MDFFIILFGRFKYCYYLCILKSYIMKTNATGYEGYNEDEGGEFKECWEKGYTKCQEDNIDKKFTLDDMKKACAVGIDIVNKEGENNFQPFEDLIKSLNKEYYENI